ncbi:unnamed protein product [Rhizophagus irregularis]|nr:unnamed protein product [Rhizophagus irregularis]
MQTDVFLAFDMMESLNKNVGSFEEVFRVSCREKDSAYNELLYSLRAVALCSFPEFIDEIKNNRAKTMNIPSDGTIHELTITTLQHLKRLTDYQETVETMLLTLGDGRGVSGNVVIQHYFADVLEVYPDIERKYEKMVKKYNDGYQDTWKPCFSNLMDTTWVRGGSALKALGSNEKSIVKEKFKNFNTEFEENI